MRFWSFSDPAAGFPSLGSYQAFIESGSYARIIWRTFLIAGEVTIATALLGYPLAYWISRLEQRSQLIAIGIVTMTFWASMDAIRGFAGDELEYLNHRSRRKGVNNGARRRVDFCHGFAHVAPGKSLDLFPKGVRRIREKLAVKFLHTGSALGA